MKSNIVFIGFSGVGKTSVGEVLARLLKMNFYDTDLEIQASAGMKVSDFFQKYGEIQFRSEEHETVKKVSQYENSIISTGGGVVLNQKNLEILKENGIVVCLTARPEVIYQRIEIFNNRPLLKEHLYMSILRLMKEREGLYDEADFILDTSELEVEQVIDRILTFLIDYRIQQAKLEREKSKVPDGV